MAESGHSILITLFLLLIKTACSGHEECAELSFSQGAEYEPLIIKFPFQLINGTHDRCAHPEFCLYYCTEKNRSMLVLPTSSGPIQFLVDYIDYEFQLIVVSDPENCLPMKFLKLISSSFRPYRFNLASYDTKTAFFNCSSIGQALPESKDMISCPICTFGSDDSVLGFRLDLVSFTKMFDVDAPHGLSYNQLDWSWQKPNCTECEAKGEKCRWKNNSTNGETECFDCNGKLTVKRKTIHVPKSLIYTATGSILFGLVVIKFFKIYLHFREKEEDQVRVDKFLEDYRAQKPARFSYSDLKRITGGFKEKLGEGSHGTVFKGKLSNEILVAVKMLNNKEGGEGKEFINEVGIMGKIHHINVVRLLGFCAEGIHRALVYNLFPNGSLQSFIFPLDDKDHFLGWEKLQQIALGIAKGIEYLHDGCNHPILHFDINPHNVLLDDNFTPKISDFGLAKLCSKNLSVVSMTAARGTLGYMAPEVFSRNFGNVSFKSDIYSYGMLLLEMVGGRKNMDMSSTEAFKILYPEWIHNLLEGDIHIHIEDEDDVKTAKKLAIIGLWCIQWQPVNRPSIKVVVQMLETGEVNELPVPPNPFHPMTSTITGEYTLARQAFQMEVIQE